MARSRSADLALWALLLVGGLVAAWLGWRGVERVRAMLGGGFDPALAVFPLLLILAGAAAAVFGGFGFYTELRRSWNR